MEYITGIVSMFISYPSWAFSWMAPWHAIIPMLFHYVSGVLFLFAVFKNIIKKKSGNKKLQKRWLIISIVSFLVFIISSFAMFLEVIIDGIGC